MSIDSFLSFSFLLLLSNNTLIKKIVIEDKSELSKKSISLKIKTKYDTLIPIFDSLFITYSEVDSVYLSTYSKKTAKDPIWFAERNLITKETKKWGVIDNKENVIIPFICDGIKKVSNNKGILSVALGSFPLNTNIPRYMYCGNYYFFEKTGILSSTETRFDLKIEYIGDFHLLSFIIEQGPSFYLPIEHRKTKE